MSRRSIGLTTLALVSLMVIVAGCSHPGPAISKTDPATAVSMLDSSVVIDVRTPAEYAAGHIVGALNIDVEGADFGSRIATLDKAATYLVYCHSGRRSALAAEQMAAAGFTTIVDIGAMSDLLAAGAPLE